MRNSHPTATLSPLRELHAPPHVDRRKCQRVRQPFTAEISEWHGDRCGPTFAVQIQDMSTHGIGIVHSDRLTVGAKYLLEVPRPQRQPLAAIFTVVRCDQIDGGLFHTDLEPQDILDLAVRASIFADRSRTPASGALRRYVVAASLTAILVAIVLFS